MLSKPSKTQATPLPALAQAAKWKIENTKTGFSNLFKIVIIKETGIQGYSLRRRWFQPPANSILTEIKYLSFLANRHQTQYLVHKILRNNLGLERKII